MSAGTTPTSITSRHVAKGVGTTLLSRFGSVIELVAQPLYVAMFGLASFGLYSVLWAAVNLLENICDLGMTSAMQRTVPKASSDKAAVASLRAAMVMGVGPCLIVAMTVVLFAPVIAPWLNVAARDQHLVTPSIRLFVWALPLWAFVEIATSALRARHLFGAEIRLRIMWEQIIRLCLAILFYFLGWGLTGLFTAHMLSLTITVGLSVRLLARHYRLEHLLAPGDGSAMFSETAKAGLSVLPANIVARLFGDAPSIAINLILPGQAGASAAALYTIARKISSLVQNIRTTFSYVLAPLAASAAAQNMEQVRNIYAYTTRLSTALALPLSFALAAMAMPILAVFGHGAEVARDAVIILMMARAIEALLGNAVPVLQVTGQYRSQFHASIVGLLVYVAAALLLAPISPLTGMAAAVGIGLIVATAIPMAQLYWHDGLHPFDRQYGRVLGRALLIAALVMAVNMLIAALPPLIAIIMSTLAGLAAIWLSCRFALDRDDRLSLGKTGRALKLV